MKYVTPKIRWGRKQVHKNRSKVNVEKVISQLESDLDDAYARLDRLESYVMELAHETGAYLPSFSSRAFRK